MNINIPTMKEFIEYRTIDVPRFIRNKHNVNWTKKEAVIYKEWILKNYEKRADYLIEYLKRQDIADEIRKNENKPEIFLTIWRWYRKNCKVEKRSKISVLLEKMDMLRKEFAVDQEDIDAMQYRLTTRSEEVAIDIGFYMAQEILKNHPNITWKETEAPKNDIEANLYQLEGFHDCEELEEGEEPFEFGINPLGYIGSLCDDMFDREAESTDESLYKMYLELTKWAEG